MNGVYLCEMKRLFVRPAFRGRGVGRKLAETIIAEARMIGYATLRLDTLPRMQSATALYESLGFTRVPAYYATPLAGAIFMELKRGVVPALQPDSEQPEETAC
jgi:ribosomal protein S18 acetylase RimI-like enzyme